MKEVSASLVDVQFELALKLAATKRKSEILRDDVIVFEKIYFSKR